MKFVYINKPDKTSVKLKSLAILAIIILSLIPVYLLNRFMQKMIRPRASLGRLFLYLLSGFAMVFAYTFLIVFIIKKLFPGA
jgi:hypothetical protein